MDQKLETYLGDGLYASFDGWHMVLRAPRDGGDHWIGLEPAVFAKVLAFAKRINDQYNAKHFPVSISAVQPG